jgi:hypothetical protein
LGALDLGALDLGALEKGLTGVIPWANVFRIRMGLGMIEGKFIQFDLGYKKGTD